MRRIAVFLFALLSAPAALAATPAQIDDARAKAIAYLIQAQRGDGSFTSAPGLEVQSTSAVVEALANAGMKSSQAHVRALAWLLNTDPASIDGQARRVTALQSSGVALTPMLDKLLLQKARTDRAVWGTYSNFDTSFPDTPLVWNAIRAAGYTYTNQVDELGNAVYCEVLPAQHVDGGWSYIKPASGAPASATASALLPTAYLVRELQAERASHGWDTGACSGGASYSLVTAINNGVSYLLSKRNADGGFGEGGVSGPLETALAYRAIQSVNAAHAALSPAQDFLINSQQTNGAWGNVLATGLVLSTFAATVLADADRDGLPDVAEPILLTNVNVAERSGVATGNGQATVGLTTARTLPAGYVNSAYSTALGASTGYALASGALPPGLTLAPDGAISGTPTQIGTYNFTYTAVSGTELVQIAVIASAVDGDVPTLPEWGAIVLAMLMLAALAQQRRRV